MILALDSSTRVLSLALGKPSAAGIKWTVTRELPEAAQHGATLPGAFEELLAQAGAQLDDLTGVAVGLGPGSFTGLRVGIATVQALCYARSLPLRGVSSLRALALAAVRAGAPSPVAAAIDARHGEVYLGVYEGPLATPLQPELALPPEQVAGALGTRREAATLVGDGVRAYPAPFARDFAQAQLGLGFADHPRAREVGELCHPMPAFSLEALFAVQPSYVRASEAEIKFPQGTFRPRDG